MHSDGWHRLSEDTLRSELRTRRLGRIVKVFDELESTNLHVLRLTEQNRDVCDGMVVFAEHQTCGRGRLGRRWESPRGAGLLMTVLLREPRDFITPGRLMMSAGVSTCRAIEDTTDVEPTLRWPNDVFVAQRKLAGILIETKTLPGGERITAIGIGINCLQQPAHFPVELRARATSLEIESRHPVNRPALAIALLTRLDELLADPAAASDHMLREEWQRRSNDAGQHVRLACEGVEYTGRIIEVDAESGLLLQLDEGGRRWFEAATSTRLP